MPECASEDCKTPARTRGLCHRCYNRDSYHRGVSPQCSRCATEVPPRYRYCVPCAEAVKAEQRERYARERRERFWSKAKCPGCDAAPAERGDSPVARPKLCDRCRADQRRASVLWHRYRITVSEYDALLKKQGGGCGICGATEAKPGSPLLYVDHCHGTGAVRGLLCNGCNVAIGHLREDVARLQAAIKYLT